MFRGFPATQSSNGDSIRTASLTATNRTNSTQCGIAAGTREANPRLGCRVWLDRRRLRTILLPCCSRLLRRPSALPSSERLRTAGRSRFRASGFIPASLHPILQFPGPRRSMRRNVREKREQADHGHRRAGPDRHGTHRRPAQQVRRR